MNIDKIFIIKWYSEFDNHSIEGASLITAKNTVSAEFKLKLTLLNKHCIPMTSTIVKGIVEIN